MPTWWYVNQYSYKPVIPKLGCTLNHLRIVKNFQAQTTLGPINLQPLVVEHRHWYFLKLLGDSSVKTSLRLPALNIQSKV